MCVISEMISDWLVVKVKQIEKTENFISSHAVPSIFHDI